MASRRRITMVLEEGSKDGIMSVTDSKWNAGKLYVAPRDKIADVLAMPDSKNFGVYLLLSDEKVYVGKASELKTRVLQHHATKDWWTKVVMLTTTNNTLDSNQITFLEKELIKISLECNTYDSENNKGGDRYNPNADNIIDAEDYLEQVLDVLDFIGIKVFVKNQKPGMTAIVDLNDYTVAYFEKQSNAKQLVSENGVDILQGCSYAKLGSNGLFNIDSQKSLQDSKWQIILNDHRSKKVICIELPPDTLKVYGFDKFNVRSDDANRFSMKIDPETYIERKSEFDFSKYIIKVIAYPM